MNILLESVPKDIDLKGVEKEMKKIKEIKEVHDTHIWCIGSRYNVLTAHVVVPDMKICDTNRIIDKINKILEEKFNISHTTLAFESAECGYKNNH